MISICFQVYFLIAFKAFPKTTWFYMLINNFSIYHQPATLAIYLCFSTHIFLVMLLWLVIFLLTWKTFWAMILFELFYSFLRNFKCLKTFITSHRLILIYLSKYQKLWVFIINFSISCVNISFFKRLIERTSISRNLLDWN